MADNSRAIHEGGKFRVSIQSRQRHFDSASKDAEKTISHSNKGTALPRTLRARIRGKNSHTHCHRKAVSFDTANAFLCLHVQMKLVRITKLQN